MSLTRITSAVLPLLIIAGFIATVIAFSIEGLNAGIVVGLVAVAICVSWRLLRDWLFGLKRRVLAHIELPSEKLTFINKEIGASRQADFLRTLQRIAEDKKFFSLGIGGEYSLETLKDSTVLIRPITYKTFEVEDGKLVNLPNNGVYFFYVDDVPFVAMVANENSRFDFGQEESLSTGNGWHLQIIAPSLDAANQAISFLQNSLASNSIYRGQVLNVATPPTISGGQTIRFSERSTTQVDEIVLPEDLMNTVMRLVRAHATSEDHSCCNSRFGGMGLLLHGAPGTGKTLLIRHLISYCKDHTVVVPADMAVETLRETFRLAKYLRPAMIVLEDIDLLANHRDQLVGNEGLQELMNQLDGLPSTSGAIVLMSTNRPQAVEPALSSRPGRVSQVIETPLPDAEARKRLFNKFLQSIDCTHTQIDHWIERTEGASPAFLKELCKRAILIAEDAATTKTNGNDSPGNDTVAALSDSEFERAIYELVVLGGELSTNVLGFPSFKS